MRVLIIPEDFRNDQYLLQPLFDRLFRSLDIPANVAVCQDLPNDWRWSEVRAEVSVKERYFAPLAQQRGVADGLGQGRKRLGAEAARNVTAIRQKCREDFDRLARRIPIAPTTPLTSSAPESL